MANYIEDPQIARSIDALKARWPAIGAAADHPLTEFFIHKWEHLTDRKAGHIFKRSLKAAYGNCVFSSTLNGLPKRYDFTRPGELLHEVGDLSQWQQFWMAPVSFRDIVGVVLGYSYCRHHRQFKDQHRIFWGGSVMLTGIMTAALFGSIPEFGPSMNIHLWNPAHWAYIVAVLFMLNMCLISSLQEATTSLTSCLASIEVSLRRHQRRLVFQELKELFEACIYIQFLLLNGFAFVYAATVGSFWFPVFTSIFTCFYYCRILRSLSRRDVDKRFLRLVEREGPLYEKYREKILKR